MIRFDVDIDLEGLEKLSDKFSLNGPAQRALDEEIKKDSSKKVPLDQGALQASVFTHSSPGRIVWQTPYAKRWYYESANFAGAPERGNRWFERAKAGNVAKWTDVVRKVVLND